MRDALTAIADIATRHGETAAIVMIGAGVVFILGTIWSWTRAMNASARAAREDDPPARDPAQALQAPDERAADASAIGPLSSAREVTSWPPDTDQTRRTPLVPPPRLRSEDRTPPVSVETSPLGPDRSVSRPVADAAIGAVRRPAAIDAPEPFGVRPGAPSRSASRPTSDRPEVADPPAGPRRQPPAHAEARALGDAVAATPPSVVLLTVPEDRDRAETLGLALTATGLAQVEVVEVRDGATAIATSASTRADCVVALWSAASTELMRRPTPLVHVAREALRHGSLQAAMIDPTPTPLGFGHIGAFDLTLWAGDPNATSFRVFAQTLRRRGEENRRRRLRAGAATNGFGQSPEPDLAPTPTDHNPRGVAATASEISAGAEAARGIAPLPAAAADAAAASEPGRPFGAGAERAGRSGDETGLTDLVRAIETLARNARVPDAATTIRAPASETKADAASPAVPAEPPPTRAASRATATATARAGRVVVPAARASNDHGRAIGLVSARLGAVPAAEAESRPISESSDRSRTLVAAAPDFGYADCTIFAPRAALAGTPVSVSVVLHAPQDAFDAADLARDPDAPPTPELATAGALILEVRLDAPGFAVDKPVQRMVWTGRPCVARFTGRFVDDAKPTRRVTLRVRAFAEGAPYGVGSATVTVSSPVEGEEPPAQGEPGGWPLKRHRTGYLCFADADVAAVTAHAATLRRLGVEVEDDNLTLNAKERWGKSLQNRITRTDVVLVYWSGEASASKFVCREAEFAQRAQTLGGGRPDIVPVVLEPVGTAPKGYDPDVFEDPIRALLWDAGAARAY